jgi:cell division protein FtsB
MVTILVFNRHGLIELAGLKGQVDSISSSVESLSNEIDSLRTEIERLRNDSLYLESKVREILGWGREGEFVIRFPEPDSTGGLF